RHRAPHSFPHDALPILPEGCFAEAQVHVGSRVEVDVATCQQNGSGAKKSAGAPGGVAVATWAPPAATLVMPNVFPDEIEIQVFSDRKSTRLNSSHVAIS